MKKPKKSTDVDLPEGFEPSKLADRDLLVKALSPIDLDPAASDKAGVNGLRIMLDVALAHQRSGRPDLFDSVKEERHVVFAALNDCQGILVDAKSADCSGCPDIADCVKELAFNLGDGWKSKISDLGLTPKDPSKITAKVSATKLVVFEIDNPFDKKSQRELYLQAKHVMAHGTDDLTEVENLLKEKGFTLDFDKLHEAGVVCYPHQLPQDVVDGLPKTVRDELGLKKSKKKES